MIITKYSMAIICDSLFSISSIYIIQHVSVIFLLNFTIFVAKSNKTLHLKTASKRVSTTLFALKNKKIMFDDADNYTKILAKLFTLHN